MEIDLGVLIGQGQPVALLAGGAVAAALLLWLGVALARRYFGWWAAWAMRRSLQRWEQERREQRAMWAAIQQREAWQAENEAQSRAAGWRPRRAGPGGDSGAARIEDRTRGAGAKNPYE